MSTQTLNHTMFRRAALPVAVALLAALAASPAFAEGNTAATMTPPAPNAANSAPQAENSLPENAETSTFNLPGSSLAATSVTAARTAHAAQPSGQ